MKIKKSCEYCEGISNPYNAYTKCGLRIEDGVLFAYMRGDNHCANILVEREINYCPFCGAKIKAEKIKKT